MIRSSVEGFMEVKAKRNGGLKQLLLARFSRDNTEGQNLIGLNKKKKEKRSPFEL